jgi:hypothetical protein
LVTALLVLLVAVSAKAAPGGKGAGSGGGGTAEAKTPPIHLSDLWGSSVSDAQGWYASVVASVHGSAHEPVANVTVSGSWSDGTKGAGSCVTNVNGVCEILSKRMSTVYAYATFTVTGLKHATSPYSPADNESSGTITVYQNPPMPTPTPTPAPPPPDDSIHVGDLDASMSGSSGWYVGTVTVYVEDAWRGPVAGADVRGFWTGGGGGLAWCKTDSLGKCDVLKGSNETALALTITSLDYAGLTYAPECSHDPDGDSDGVTISFGVSR